MAPRLAPALVLPLLLLLHHLSSPAGAFNVDVHHATVIGDPSGRVGSYFGFAVALAREGNVTWVIVWAPKGCSPNGDGACTGGAIHRCRDDVGTTVCWTITPPLTPEAGRCAEGCEGGREAWAGWTVAVQRAEEEGGRIAILVAGVCPTRPPGVGAGRIAGRGCGPSPAKSNRPRGQRRQYNPSGDSAWAVWCRRPLPWGERTEGVGSPPAASSVRDDKEHEPRKEDVSHYVLPAAAGITANFVRDSNEILIGVPGAFKGRGAIIRHQDPESNMGTRTPYLLSSTINVACPSVPVPKTFHAEEMNRDSYFGYSVSSGRFFRENKTLYVSSSPRSNSLWGKVFIFDIPETEGGPFIIKFELEGSQMWEYFGFSLCVEDLNSDGLDDLIVGAPHHSLEHHHSDATQQSGDEGRIYVFLNQDAGRMADIGHQIMGSKRPGARFGISVASIGDLNGDGFPDVAVGAAYENAGRGAVYIYHGSIGGVKPHYIQHISALEIDHSLLGFGISISRGLGMEGIHDNDIAVGAYLSGNVVILRSHPIVRFQTSLITNVGKMDIQAGGFLRACINYSGVQVPISLVASVTLTAKAETDDVYLVANTMRNITYSYFPELKLNINQCERFGLEITEVSKGSSRPIEVTMEFKIAKEDEGPKRPSNYLKQTNGKVKNLYHLRPVVDPMLPNSIMIKIPRPAYCGKDHVCTTDIESEVTIDGVMFPFVVGSAEFLEMRVLVKNNGGPGNLVQTRVIFPRVIPLRRLPQNCQEYVQPSDMSSKILLLCEMGNLILTEEMKHLLLIFDMKSIPSGYDRLIFKVSSTSAGEDSKPENNDKEIIMPLTAISDVSISGKSFQERVHVYKKDYELNSGISFSHVYEVYTLGPSPLNWMRFIFKVPTSMETSSGTIKFVKVYHPQTSDGYPSILCSYDKNFQNDSSIPPTKEGQNINYKIELNKAGKRGFQRMMGMNPSKVRKKRIKRNPDDEEENEGGVSYLQDHVPSDRSFVGDCSLPQFKCTTLYCVVGPMQSAKTRAEMTIPMKLFPAAAENILQEKDVMILRSSGEVAIEDISNSIQPDIHEPDLAYVSTIFFGKFQEFRIDIWILLISILGAVMLMLPMILFLF